MVEALAPPHRQSRRLIKARRPSLMSAARFMHAGVSLGPIPVSNFIQSGSFSPSTECAVQGRTCDAKRGLRLVGGASETASETSIGEANKIQSSLTGLAARVWPEARTTPTRRRTRRGASRANGVLLRGQPLAWTERPYAASGTARARAKATLSRASIVRSAWSATRSMPRTRR